MIIFFTIDCDINIKLYHRISSILSVKIIFLWRFKGSNFSDITKKVLNPMRHSILLLITLTLIKIMLKHDTSINNRDGKLCKIWREKYGEKRKTLGSVE